MGSDLSLARACIATSSFATEVDTSLLSLRVTRVLDRLAIERGLPNSTTLDNGAGFAGRTLDVRAYAPWVHLHFVDPGKPVQNAYIESLDGQLRDECHARTGDLDARLLATGADSHVVDARVFGGDVEQLKGFGS